MMVLSSLNKKGGVGKTTTLIGVAYELRRQGLRVGVIDCDPNGSASRWLAETTLESVSCNHDDLASLSAHVAADYDYLLIDSPPNDIEAIANVAAVSDLVIVPLAPTAIETDQLADTSSLIPFDTPWIVVPVRVRLSTAAGREIRQLLDTHGIRRTRSIVTMSEAVARSFGDAPPRLAFAALTVELVEHLQEGAA